jgi:eukaryotic-like serine/threonine-protein kinase
MPGLRPPLITGDVVYVGNRDKNFYALDRATGKELWRFQGQDWLVTDPLYADGIVYVSEGNHEMNKEGKRLLYALDAKTGKELWHFESASRINAAPAVADGAVYILGTQGEVYALE